MKTILSVSAYLLYLIHVLRSTESMKIWYLLENSVAKPQFIFSLLMSQMVGGFPDINQFSLPSSLQKFSLTLDLTPVFKITHSRHTQHCRNHLAALTRYEP